MGGVLRGIATMFDLLSSTCSHEGCAQHLRDGLTVLLPPRTAQAIGLPPVAFFAPLQTGPVRRGSSRGQGSFAELIGQHMNCTCAGLRGFLPVFCGAPSAAGLTTVGCSIPGAREH